MSIKLPLFCHDGCPDTYAETSLPAFVMGIVNVTPDSFWEGSRVSSSCGAENNFYNVHEYFLLLFHSFTDISDAVGQGFVRKGAGKGVLHIGKHTGQHRPDMLANDTPVAGVLVNVQKMGLRLLHNRLINLRQRQPLRGKQQRITADSLVAMDNPGLFQ